ncbi:MAG: protein tyrosine phosphatase family protein [Pseudomonadota bacterium]
MKPFTLHLSPIRGLITAAITVFSSTALSQDALEDVLNYVEYSPTFASAGQPDAEQFRAIRDAGFERVVYIAFTTNDNALPDADRIVEDLGMDYLHIPVEWTDPRPRDFYIFADAMQRNPDMKTLLHCQVNARATAFSFLYRVIHDDIDIATAKADMNTVWQPNETWRDFIFTVLEQEGIDPRCEDCDWAPSDTGN